MTANTVKIHYFARCRDLVGLGEETIALPTPCTVQEAMDFIVGLHPSLKTVASSTRLAVNCEFSRGSDRVEPGDELALIPPVSGGVGSLFRMMSTPITLESAVNLLGAIGEENGGLATFAGIVRRQSQGTEVAYLEYEAYEKMAVKKMEEIAVEAKGKWAISEVAVAHRVGKLMIGDVAVSIAVSAPHRAPALEACRYVIDRLKEDVPIWKKETGLNGEEWWGKGP